MRGPTRRFATVLFLDIVGSTAIAGALGDEGWRRLLGRFRSTVRTELRRNGGHEVDTAGDGFFATFTDPLPAIRAAAAIAEAVHTVGVDVRMGIHAGEIEVEGRRVAGINVHIAARAMALAGPAQIVVTRTVRDIEHGSPVVFADAGVHELKGVGGDWQLYAVTSVDDHRVHAPLDPRQALDLQRLNARPNVKRYARPVSAIVLGLAVAVAVLGWVMRPAHPASAPARSQLILLRIDPQTQRKEEVSAPPEDGYLPAPANLSGTLLRARTDAVERRDMTSGAVIGGFRVPGLSFMVGTAGSTWTRIAVGAGGVWVGSGILFYGRTAWSLEGFDPNSGTKIASTQAPDGMLSDPIYGPRGIWFLSADADLSRLDPLPPYHVRPWHTSGWAADAQLAVPYVRGVWLIAPDRLVWFEPGTRRHHAIQLGPGESPIVEGTDAYSFDRVWVLDTVDQSITPLGEGAEDPSRSLGVVNGLLSGVTDQEHFVAPATSVDGYLWIAGRSSVLGIPEHGGALPVSVKMPSGFGPDYLVSDEATGSLWVGSCYCDTWWAIHPV
jgi:class 3 adenylate cyclase